MDLSFFSWPCLRREISRHPWRLGGGKVGIAHLSGYVGCVDVPMAGLFSNPVGFQRKPYGSRKVENTHS